MSDTTHRLQKRLRGAAATVTVVDRQPNLTYQPFLYGRGSRNRQPAITNPTTRDRVH